MGSGECSHFTAKASRTQSVAWGAGHNVPTMIGVDHRDVARKIMNLVPDYMVMGERGMAEMGSMEMPLPENTLPMMTGQGPFGPL